MSNGGEMHRKCRHTGGAEVFCRCDLGCVASQALAGSVVCFLRPTCLNDDDEDKKKKVACSWEVGSCDPCRVVLSVNEFVVCCPWVTASSCCSYRTELAKRKHTDECVPRHPGTPPESGSEGSSRKSYIWRLHRAATWRQLYRHLLHMRNAPEEKMHATDVCRFHLKEVHDDVEDKHLLEEVSVDSDVVGATTSGRGGQSLHKGSGEFSTKECGESSQE